MTRVVSLVLGLALAAGSTPTQPVTSDPGLAAGIRQVEDGDFDAAIVTLDAAARRLVSEPRRAHELSQAYLYLGIAYVGKGHEAAAKAKFREAVLQMRELSLSPEKFPPKIINLFEAARAEAARTPPPQAAPAQAKKGGGSKTVLLIGGGAVAVGLGAVALAGGGGGGGNTGGGTAVVTTPPVSTEPITDAFPGVLTTAQSAASVGVGPVQTAGPWKAEFSWSDPAADIHMFVVNDVSGTGMGDVRLLSPITAILEWPGTAGTRYRMDLFLQEGGPPSVSFLVKVTHPR
jgi:hypothetical protein